MCGFCLLVKLHQKGFPRTCAACETGLFLCDLHLFDIFVKHGKDRAKAVLSKAITNMPGCYWKVLIAVSNH